MWYQNKFKIKDDTYISCFITYKLTSEQLNLLNECVKELYKNHKLSTTILNFIHLLDYHRFTDGIAFDKGIYLYKHYLYHELWLADETDSQHNLTTKVLDKFKISYQLYRRVFDVNNSFAFNIFLVDYINNDTLYKMSNDLANKFILFNREQEFQNAIYSMLQIEHIMFFDVNYMNMEGVKNEKS